MLPCSDQTLGSVRPGWVQHCAVTSKLSRAGWEVVTKLVEVVLPFGYRDLEGSFPADQCCRALRLCDSLQYALCLEFEAQGGPWVVGTSFLNIFEVFE